MTNSPSVSISYAKDKSDEQALARELYQRLQDAGIADFLDEENTIFCTVIAGYIALAYGAYPCKVTFFARLPFLV